MHYLDLSVLLMIPVMLVQLLVLGFSLRWLELGSQTNRFTNAWLLWLILLVSLIVNAFIFDPINSWFLREGFYFTGLWESLVYLLTQLPICIFASWILICVLNRRSKRRNIELFDNETTEPKKEFEQPLKTAVTVSVIGVVVLIFSIVMTASFVSLYEHYFPKPVNKFGIYD